MTKDKVKKIFDYIPLAILLGSAMLLIWTAFSSDIELQWKHITGLFFLPIIAFAFWYRHKVGVLTLGFSLLIGLISLLSYSPAITTSTWFIGKTEEGQIPVFYGQPIFLLWLLLHFILSHRHYDGIVTKKYWKDLLKNDTEKARA
jgi:hypothetical protein